MQFKDIDSEVQKGIMSQMIHNSPYGKLVINKDHIICGVNKTICTVTGYHPSELYGENINMLLDKKYHEMHTKHLTGWFNHPIKKDLKVREMLTCNGTPINVRIKLFDINIWQANSMIQPGEVKKPNVLGCAAIVFEDE